MRKFSQSLLLVFVVLLSYLSPIQAQSQSDFFPRPDTFCVSLDTINASNLFIGSVTANDGFIPAGVSVVSDLETPCLVLNELGRLWFPEVPTANCCGEYMIRYRYLGVECPNGACESTVFVKIICPKPNCDWVDLDPLLSASDPTGEQGHRDCIQACENSSATYYVSYQPGYTYDWLALNGSVSYTAAPPAEVQVDWGPMAANSSLSLIIGGPNGSQDTFRFCVELAESPIAGFNFTPTGCVNSPVCFTNTSTGAATYFWDFGDGNFSTDANPCHEYSTGGNYTVTLSATSAGGTNPDGSLACCCTDVITMDIEIDPRPGPNIYWISTLCEGDNSLYWTDADCSTYTWTVTDANGASLPFTTNVAGDTIEVNWGAGPEGYISLVSSGCSQQYCPQGTTVTVPIISSSGQTSGDQDVCQGATEVYSLPKWPGVTYEWNVSGGSIIGSNTGHQIIVQWGSVGTGTISVTYGSDFLAGLPNHGGIDCTGSANYTVNILGNWQLIDNFNGRACLNGNSFLFTTSDFPGATFSWTITPGPVNFSDFGNSISIDWSSSPGVGTYTVTATPLSPGPADYCIASQTRVISVIGQAPAAGIDGPLEYCPGEDAVYSIVSPQAGLNYFWTVSGGTLVSGNGSPQVVVNLTSNSTATLTVFASQTSAPFCSSTPVGITAAAKTLLPLTSLAPATACINQVQTYSILPGQHPETNYHWTISPATAGSVIAGQGSEQVDIQWNNSNGNAAITVVAELCGQTETYTENLMLNVPSQPMISQSNGLCPGVSATLSVNPSLFSAATWSPGGAGFSITITNSGTYVVNTTDLNACEAVTSYTAQQQVAPTVLLARQGPEVYCVPQSVGTTVNLLAFNNPNYTFQWYCNGVLQAETSATFTHTVTNTSDAVFTYYYVATDITTGCQATSLTKRVVHSNCNGGPGCEGTVAFNASASNQFPNCNVVDLNATVVAPVIDIQWRWPLGTPLSVVSGSGSNLTVAFSQADCYDLVARYTFVNPRGDTCFRDTIINVCVPLAADFEYASSCDTVTFTNTSTVLGATTFTSSWDFGDGNTSTAFEPSHVYSSSGTYTVTLTVMDAQGCMATISKTITTGTLMNPVITLSPAPYCVGDAISMQGTANTAIQYFWDFGDNSQFIGPNPSHSYLSAGSYTIVLTTTDAAGCTATTSENVTIAPNPLEVSITASPGLIACEGESITLCVPVETGVTYTWSNSATGNCITVNSAGTYSVTLTTADGCSYASDEVEVSFLPGPPATVLGSSVLCDGEAVTLSGPSGFYTYSWINGANMVVGSSQQITLGAAAIANNPYTLLVTDANGCQSSSAPINLSLANSPQPLIDLSSGSGCEGEANTLSINPASFDPNHIYTWSTGQTGPSTIVAAAGTYTVQALDPATGCIGTASYDIHPIPDVCIVPFGCYESCRPDTICGPDGADLTYQWYFEGNPISTDQCYIATLSGAYYLEVTNSFGCTATTDSLILEMIDCGNGDCEDIITRLASLEQTGCCYALSYLNLPAGTFGVQINSPDALLNVDVTSLAGGYQPYIVDGNTFEIGSNPAGRAIPSNSPGSLLNFCLEDPSSSPQQIIISYLDANLLPFCSDTFLVDCTPEPPCIYVTQDTITCTPDKTYELTFTVCRPLTADFDVAFIELLPHSSAAAADLPQGFVINPPLTATNPCTTITVVLTTTAMPGDDFCYTVVAHTEDPRINPAALCCESEDTYCLVLPDCEPCDDLGVIAVDGAGDEEDCCFVVSLFNNVTSPALDGIVVCPLDPNSTLTAYTSLGGPWIATSGASNSLQLQPAAGLLPNGNFSLPRICQEGNISPIFELEIKWMQGDSVVCRDTIEYKCDPDCGYLLEESIVCQDGNFIWQGMLFNTSNYPMNEAYLVFDPASGLSSYNTNFSFSTPVPPGGSAPISITIGPPAMSGDTICVQVYLHETNDTDNHLNCCDFKAVLVMPACDDIGCIDPNQINESTICTAIFEPVCGCDGVTYSNSCVATFYGGVTSFTPGPCEPLSCDCDSDFFEEVDLLYTAQIIPGSSTVNFQANGAFGVCDSIAWTALRLGTPNRFLMGTGRQLTYSFPSGALYSICMEVFRTAQNGETCNRRRCRILSFNANPVVFPNPSTGILSVISPARDELPNMGGSSPQPQPRFTLTNLQGKTVQVTEAASLPLSEEGIYSLDLRALPKGVYFLRCEDGKQQWTEKIILQ